MHLPPDTRNRHRHLDDDLSADHHGTGGALFIDPPRRHPAAHDFPKPVHPADNSLLLQPAAFDLTTLPLHHRGATSAIAEFLQSSKVINIHNIPSTIKEAGLQLAIAVFALDLGLLRKLLHTVGIPANTPNPADLYRTAFHTLALVGAMGDAQPKSHVFRLLKGQVSWLSEYMDPPLPNKQHSVLARDILNSLNPAMLNIAQWLYEAGGVVTEGDDAGFTPLHYAAYYGLTGLVQFLLERGALPNHNQNEATRSPAHLAAAQGHADVLALLLRHGADFQLKDCYQVAPMDIISSPGPVAARDALLMLNVTQRPVKSIDRKIHPERILDGSRGGWVAGDGGWSQQRLSGFETDMQCDIDQYWADEIDGQQLFDQYLARNTPVLVRGLFDQSTWPAVDQYRRETLYTSHGGLSVTVSDIPYAVKFGGSASSTETLQSYLDQVKEHRMLGGNHPWYVFKGHPIPNAAEARDSLVRYDYCPTPKSMADAFQAVGGKEQGSGSPSSGEDQRRKLFVNAQWAVGGEGTGAPVHYHNSAWNALVFGAKKWVAYPPHHQIMSNKQILDFFETDLTAFKDRLSDSVLPKFCVQTAGDVMIIPESWGHGVLNIQESVAVATEAKHPHWRLHTPSALLRLVPAPDR